MGGGEGGGHGGHVLEMIHLQGQSKIGRMLAGDAVVGRGEGGGGGIPSASASPGHVRPPSSAVRDASPPNTRYGARINYQRRP